MKLLSPVIKSEQFETLQGALAKPGGRAALFGVHPIHRAVYAAALAEADPSRPVFYLCETDAEAVTAAEDIRELGIESGSFTSRDFVFIDVEGTSHDSELARLAVLGRICQKEISVVCCSLEALCQYTIPKSSYLELSILIKKGGKVDLKDLVGRLVAAGYTRGDRVEGRGQFAVRGGIVDIFPAHSEKPLRIELFGNDVDGISSFDEQTQRRRQSLKTAVITPSREVVVGHGDIKKLGVLAENSKKAAELHKIIERDIALLMSDITPACTDRYLRTVYDKPETILDYLPGAVVFICEPSALEKRHKNLLWQHTEELLSLEKQGLYLKNNGSFYLENIDTGSRPVVLVDVFSRTLDGRLDAVVNLRAGVIPRWGGETSLLIEDLRGYVATGYACVVLAGTARAAAALAGDIDDAGLSCSVLNSTLPAAGAVGVAVGSLSSGFDIASLKLCVIASRREKKLDRKRPKAKKKHQGRGINSLEDIKPWDYVVHQSHGIGVFDGIHRIDHHGFVRDYIKIKYRGEDTLYVPVTQLDLVSQYISPKDDDNIKLAKLHSGEWNKTKQSVYRSVREMAKELIELYARREKSEGISFSKDTDWQRGFESRFAYDETDDQLRAVSEIKKDMEKASPMDRLLCGDVGVGKTEVALRAVFKCVSDGYQCAVLVPTTILAWQHYHTFLERMEAYPIKVTMLSRFASAKEICAAVAGIKDGTVDIVVGTHRLLQKDIQFKKLGLLVVDEEQRFGVAHKEKLKEAFAGVDVLTLSATPIPRTLNMAMSGIRDMSVIEEPPEDRHPVQTFVTEYDESIILDAIKRELSRGGQVYYLHNRVETIDRTAARLAQLLPDASIAVAHGQMDENSLSEVWRRLLSGECDVLVCTTIIETGVDVANCNTLVVENSDHMGLSQLYQIRGRVGRSGRRAFAYFTFRRDKIITSVAAKRLSAIRDFTSFGSGFKIAMRDLQIRGAGSVLSARQSGHMAAVGYDTYLRILEQAVNDEGGQAEYRPPAECTIDLAVNAYISEKYIPDNESRIQMYKRIAAIETEDDASDVLDELRDRFGEIPKSVRTLVAVSLIRVRAGALGFYEVTAKSGDSFVVLYSDALDADRAKNYIQQHTRRVLFSPAGKSHIAAEINDGEEITAVAIEVLAGYSAKTN